MSEDFGSDFITIVDDDGQEFELEVLDTMDYNGESYTAFLPADMDENDPDYGIIILRSVLDENGDELYESIDDRRSCRTCTSTSWCCSSTTRTESRNNPARPSIH